MLGDYRSHASFHLPDSIATMCRWGICLAVVGGGFVAMLAAFEALGWLGPQPWS